MPYDVALVDLVSACVDAEVTCQSLADSLSAQARSQAGVVPSVTFRDGSLPTVMRLLAKNGHLSERFDRVANAWVYSATKDQAETARDLAGSVLSNGLR